MAKSTEKMSLEELDEVILKKNQEADELKAELRELTRLRDDRVADEQWRTKLSTMNDAEIEALKGAIQRVGIEPIESAERVNEAAEEPKAEQENEEE